MSLQLHLLLIQSATSHSVSLKICFITHLPLPRGAFAKQRKVWQSNLMNRDTKIKVSSACVKSVLSYGSETWLVTNELRRKNQTFIKIYV
jgi:hypothetical protein